MLGFLYLEFWFEIVHSKKIPCFMFTVNLNLKLTFKCQH